LSRFSVLESIVSKPSLLVIGCGDIGAAVARHFVADDWKVWGVRRQPMELPGATMLQADVTVPESLQVLAGLQPEFVLLVLTPGVFTDERYRQVYVEGLRNCLAAVDRGRLRRVFWVSSTSVFHQRDGELLDESSPAAASGFSGQRLLEAEAVLRASGIAHTAVRFGGIYGPGRDRLLRQLRSGRRSPEEPVQCSNRIHRDDTVSILQFLLARAAAGEPLHELYLGVDAEPAPIATVERWFCGALGIDYTALDVQDSELRGGNRRCSSARLQALGYRFLYPTYREGLPTLIHV
jgi:nucleoside-diphosphate-sugar epimerase